MKKAILLCMLGLAAGSFAPQAAAQEKAPEKKIKIILKEGDGEAAVYEYNSLEEMQADERLKGKRLPLLEEAELRSRIDREIDVLRLRPDSLHKELIRIQLEGASGKELEDRIMIIERQKDGSLKQPGDVLMHRSFERGELPEEVKQLLKERGIEMKEGQKVVITRIMDKMPEPPQPPQPPLPPAAPAAPAPASEKGAQPTEAAPAPDWLEELVVYPNPGSEQLRLRFKSASSGPAVVRLLDLKGKVVYEEKIPDAGNSIEKSIKVPAGNKGIFLLQIEQGGKKYSERVLLK